MAGDGCAPRSYDGVVPSLTSRGIKPHVFVSVLACLLEAIVQPWAGPVWQTAGLKEQCRGPAWSVPACAVVLAAYEQSHSRRAPPPSLHMSPSPAAGSPAGRSDVQLCLSPWHHERHARPVPAVHNVHGPTISGVRLRAVEQCFASAGHRRSATKLRGDEGRRPFLHHHLVERLQLGVLARGCTFAAEEESNSVDASLLGGRGRHPWCVFGRAAAAPSPSSVQGRAGARSSPPQARPA